jgi:putative transposase
LDYRLYDKAGDALTKNDHFRALLETAHTRHFVPECVVFDSWYSSLENLKQIRDWDWTWLTRLKANRLVNPDATSNRPVAQVDTDAHGQVVHLKGYGLIRLFLIVAPDGDKEYWATNDLNMKALTRVRFAGYAWTIETYHRGIKQYCSIERAQVRAARAQRNHIQLALRAFLRLERYCYHKGLSWFEAKLAIIRPAIRNYLAHPLYILPATA